jgi:DNA mismatch endonuclease, patch repair protein
MTLNDHRKIPREDKKKKKKAGHRSWAAKSAPVEGGHTGDIMSAEKRSALMSRIRGINTEPEIAITASLIEDGFTFETHPKDLPGKPDIVFRNSLLAVFIDGDYWHGWRFPLWEHKLTQEWREKIGLNRERDQKNFRKLRRMGWKVMRIWEHEVENNRALCIIRIREGLKTRSGST